MTHFDRQQITREIVKSLNWRMVAGFMASTVITVSSVVWTIASLYYRNEAKIRDVQVVNEQQSYIIQSNTQKINECCPIIRNMRQ